MWRFLSVHATEPRLDEQISGQVKLTKDAERALQQ